ncbi:5-deoxy-glucuronate isomerase [Pseudomonas sp. Marseille-Q8238]
MKLLVKGDARKQTCVALPEQALRYVGFSVQALAVGQRWSFDSGEQEVCLVLLCGKAGIVVNSAAFGDFDWPQLGTRESPFDDVSPDAVYLPPHCQVCITSLSPCQVAICAAPGDTDGELPPRLISGGGMARSVRGKGPNTRYVCDILPDTEAAHSLLVVEVITPSGHSSSYPPHKHDLDALPEQSLLEEVYYHRLDPEQGFVFQRVYTDDRSLDEAYAVENHDVVMVPRGYHPVTVPWGYRSYYLNVMAGPRRVWKFANDPAHEWLLDTL